MSRPHGSQNKISRLLKEGLVKAAVDSEYGHDTKDPTKPPSLNIYLTNFANHHQTEFFAALMKLIPKKTNVQSDTTIDISLTRTEDDVHRDMLNSGMTAHQIEQISQILLPDTPVDLRHLMEPENGTDDETH